MVWMACCSCHAALIQECVLQDAAAAACALLMLHNFTADAAYFHRLIAVVSWRWPVLASGYSITAV
jgi:hypothetical protein